MGVGVNKEKKNPPTPKLLPITDFSYSIAFGQIFEKCIPFFLVPSSAISLALFSYQ
jgi:hypothetical protein